MSRMMNERKAVSQLRRWCPIAETHQDIEDVACGWLDCRGVGSHRLRLRRMLVCDECEQGYFKQKEFNEHECYSAY